MSEEFMIEENEENIPIIMPRHDFELMLSCAFDYALGRSTYITGACVEWLTDFWPGLSQQMKKRTRKRIKDAIDSGFAGHNCDVAEWLKILELPID